MVDHTLKIWGALVNNVLFKFASQILLCEYEWGGLYLTKIVITPVNREFSYLIFRRNFYNLYLIIIWNEINRSLSIHHNFIKYVFKFYAIDKKLLSVLEDFWCIILKVIVSIHFVHSFIYSFIIVICEGCSLQIFTLMTSNYKCFLLQQKLNSDPEVKKFPTRKFKVFFMRIFF